ncbi:hypothetical protein V6N13_050886 [Hibiscus sabdariffa]|uniref:Uncharacterized protein n=1 Tax=Hibiscus sabdariffa TaxID=183260 RepID=A0ABR2PIN8_9ROSI
MGHQDLVVVALVFVVVFGAFVTDSSPSPPTPKASSPSKSPSSASPMSSSGKTSSPTSSSPPSSSLKSDGEAPNSSFEGEVVSSPPLTTIANELFGSLSHSPKTKSIVVDAGENVGYGEDIPTPPPSNADVVKATSVVNVVIVVGFFLL